MQIQPLTEPRAGSGPIPGAPLRWSRLLGALVTGVSVGALIVALSLGVASAGSEGVAAGPAATAQNGRSVVTPEEFGAVGDGVTDDGASLQRALDALAPGDALMLAAQHTYRHDRVLTVATPGVTISGAGTLLAGHEETSAVFLAADGITVDGPTLAAARTTRRWHSFEQMKLRLGPFRDLTVRNVIIDGSAAAGVYVGGSVDFELTDVIVRDTRADGIHITGGAHGGTVTGALILEPGDDGVSVVSYHSDGSITRDITVQSSRLQGQRWGRGFSVVGGSDITMRDLTSDRSAGAALYIAAEREFDTFGVSRVLIEDCRLTASNQQAAVPAVERPTPTADRIVHGAVMVYNSQPREDIVAVTMRRLTIEDTDTDGLDQVSVRRTGAGSIDRVSVEDVVVTGGSPYLVALRGVPDSSFHAFGWQFDGAAVGDRPGW